MAFSVHSPGYVDTVGASLQTRVIGTLGVGIGTSPILYRDLLILLCDEEDGKRSFIVGLDKKTGREVWRTKREIQVTFATPVVVSLWVRAYTSTSGLG